MANGGPGDIIQTIGIEGQEDAIAAFREIGNVGVEAFEKLEKSLLGGSEVIAGFIAGIGGIGVALIEWAKHSSEATVELDHLAKQSGATLENMSGLQGALTALGANTDFLAVAFKRMSVVIETEWQNIQKTVKERADQIINDTLAVRQTALGVDQAQEALFQARQKLLAARGLDTADSDVQKLHEQHQATLAFAEAENKLAEAQQKAAEATKKQREDNLNSLESISAAIRKISEGTSTFSEASKQANLSLDNVMKGLLVNAAPAVEQLKHFNGTIEELGQAAPEVQSLFFKVSDFMHGSGDAALNTAVAFRFFGRGVSQDVVQAMTEGSAKLKEHIEHQKALGLVLSDGKPAEEFHRSFNEMSHDIGVTAQQIGNQLAPAFTAGFRLISESLGRNHGDILQWTQTIADSLRPAIEDFFRLLSGHEVQTPWVKTIVDGARAVVSFIRTDLITAFKDLYGIMSGEGAKTDFGKAVVAVWADVKPVLQGVWDALKGIAITVEALSPAFRAMGQIVRDAAEGWKSVFSGELFSLASAAVDRWINSIVEKLANLGARIRDAIGKALLAASSALGNPASNTSPNLPEGRAGGGLIRGPGTGTSDSIPIMASDHEFMMRERATRYYGADLFNAYNNLQIPKFAAGGLVDKSRLPSAGPALAPFTLVINDKTISGLSATRMAVEQLKSESALDLMTSNGPRPSWVK